MIKVGWREVVMANSGSRHLMTVLAADQRVDLQKLEKISGEPTSLQPEKEFQSLFPDCAPGIMPPFGIYGLPTYVHKSLAQEDYIVFEAGTHTDAIKLNYRDHERIAQPQVEDFTIRLHPIKQT